MHGFYIKGYEMIILIGKIAKFDSKIVQNFEFYSKSDTEQKSICHKVRSIIKKRD